MKKIYKPELIKEETSSLPIEVKAYNGKLFSELEKGKGLIKVKLDESIVIQRISHDLYANWKSGIRELLNNEVRACKTAIKEHKQDSRIEITLDVANKKLIIHGINSLGIDSETFLRILRVLGRSDNFNGSEIGQFGFGFASYTTLSDTVILETYSLLTKEKYSVCGKSGIGFDILPKPDLNEFGTRITIIYEKLHKEDSDIYEAILNFAKYKQIPIYLVLPYPIKKSSYWNNEQYKTICESGKYLISGKSLKEILQQKILRYPDNDNAKINFERDFIVIERETKDFEFIGFIRNDNKDYDYSSSYNNKNIILLVKTPIDSDSSTIEPYHSYMINIKNERKYKPTTDRERLKGDDGEKVIEECKKLFVSDLAKLLDFETWKEFLTKSHKWNLYKKLLTSTVIHNLISYEKRNMIECLYLSFRCYEHGEIKPITKSLREILKFKLSGNMVYYSTVNIESVIKSVVDSRTLVILTKNYGLLEKLGIEDIKTVSGLGESIGKTKVSIHTSHIGKSGFTSEGIMRHTKTKLLHEVLDNTTYFKTIWFEKGISQYLDILSNTLTDYYLVQLKKKQIEWLLKEVKLIEKTFDKGYPCGIVSFEEWVKEIEKKEYLTNKGKLTPKQIMNYPYKIYLHNTDLKETINYMKNEEYLYVCVGNNEEFELKVYFSIHNVKFELFNESESFEHLHYWCSKCGVGDDDYYPNKRYGNLCFLLKKQLGKQHEHLYKIFHQASRMLVNHGYGYSETKTDIKDIEELAKLFLKFVETPKTESSFKELLRLNLHKNQTRITHFKEEGYQYG